MLPSATHSRRALAAAAGLLAAAPVSKAKKKKGKKKKKPAPLAFAVVRVTNLLSTPDPAMFTCVVDGVWRYPAAGSTTSTPDIPVLVAFGANDQIRAQIAAGVQEYVSIDLDVAGHDVPADRIAVTLL